MKKYKVFLRMIGTGIGLLLLSVIISFSVFAENSPLIHEDWKELTLWYKDGAAESFAVDSDGLHVSANAPAALKKFIESSAGKSAFYYFNADLTQTYALETKVRVTDFADGGAGTAKTAVISVNDEKFRMAFSIEADGIYTETADGWVNQTEEAVDSNWHTYRVEAENGFAYFYMDGELLFPWELTEDTSKDDLKIATAPAGDIAAFDVKYTYLDKVYESVVLTDNMADDSLMYSKSNVVFKDDYANYLFGQKCLTATATPGIGKSADVVYKIPDSAVLTTFEISAVITGPQGQVNVYTSADNQNWNKYAVLNKNDPSQDNVDGMFRYDFYGNGGMRFTYKPTTKAKNSIKNAKYFKVSLEYGSEGTGGVANQVSPALTRVELVYDSLRMTEAVIGGQSADVTGESLNGVLVRGQAMSFTFSSEMNEETLNAQTVVLKRAETNVACERIYNADTKTYTITPIEKLAYDSDYSLILMPDIKDTFGRGFTIEPIEYLLHTIASEFESNGISLVRSGDTVAAKTTLFNHSGAAAEVTLCIATYKEQKMLDYKVKAVTIPADGSSSVQTSGANSAGADETVVYVWDNIPDGSPLMEAWKE